VIARGKEEVNAIDEKMQAKDELSALVFTRIPSVRFNIEVLPKTVRQMRQKFGWRARAVQSTDEKPKRAFCDTFTDVIFTGEFSVKIERYPCRSFRKVGEQHRNKTSMFRFVSLHEETLQSQ